MSLRSAERSLTGTLEGLDTCLAWSRDSACCDTSAGSVSGWSVRAHLEHLALADETIVRLLEEVRAGDGSLVTEGHPRLLGRVILWTGRIPRGRGRAPKAVIPRDPGREEIEARLRDARARFEGLRESLPSLARSNATRPHPILGHFTPPQWLRFVDVHHRHHHRIIRDILNA